MYKYLFHINDKEFNSEYDYEGYFFTHEEADQFIAENEAVGNEVEIIAPYEIVNIEDVPTDHII